MMRYVAKKLAGLAATVLVVSFLVFAAFAVIPGDPATSMLGTQATPEKVEALREEMGLNDPLPNASQDGRLSSYREISALPTAIRCRYLPWWGKKSQ